MKKKSHKKQKSKLKLFTKLNLKIINILILTFLISAIGYLVFMLNNTKHTTVNTTIKKTTKNDELEYDKFLKQQAKRFEEKTKAMEIDYETTIDDEDIIEQNSNPQPKYTFRYPTEDKKIEDKKPKDIKINKKIVINKPDKQHISNAIKPKKNQPKLAIVIDDVSFKSQVDTILGIGYPITMSFLPPMKRHPKSAKIAKNIPFYMVHLPLQANSFMYEEAHTLHITDSLQTIDNRIKKIIQLYPKVKYINNHTGSLFTRNSKAMDKLMKTFAKYNLYFVDSRTTSKTVGKKYAKKYHVKYLQRNVFLDNKIDKRYIQNQIKKAVKIAKKYHFAIAICHPHKLTLQTLKNSKDLFDGVKLVYINNL
jgi:polysaccharide deacetylase 2 family uncharacterized protein YibQ